MRFDTRGEVSLLNQDAMDKYQQNAYLLGRIFSNQAASGSGARQEDDDEGDDFALGLLMLRQSQGKDGQKDNGFLLTRDQSEEEEASKDVAMQEGEEGDDEDQEEINDLKEYLQEMREKFIAK